MARLRAIEMTKDRLAVLKRLVETGSVPDKDTDTLDELRFWGLIDGDRERYLISERGWGFLLGYKKIPAVLVYSIPEKKTVRYETERMIGPQDIIPGFVLVCRGNVR